MFLEKPDESTLKDITLDEFEDQMGSLIKLNDHLPYKNMPTDPEYQDSHLKDKTMEAQNRQENA